MKQFCSLIIFLLGFMSLSVAQKVQYKKDQVTVDGKPYCLMTSKGVIVKDYTVKTLDGKKIATMKPEMIDNGQQNAPSDGYFLITFWESGKQCEFDMDRFNPGSRLADDLVEAGVLVDGNYSEEGEKRFLNLHKRKYSDDIRAKLSKSTVVVKVENNQSGRKSDDDSENATDKPKNSFQLVKRNREGDIDVWASKEIKQDFKKMKSL